MKKGHGAPDIQTVGNVGDFYEDLDTGKIYKLTEIVVRETEAQFVTRKDYAAHTNQYIWTAVSSSELPFGQVIVSEKMLFSYSDLEFMTMGMPFGVAQIDYFDIIPGNKYRIVFDGIEYNCTALMPYDDEPDFVFIGNVDILEPIGLGNNEPFMLSIENMPDVGPAVMIATNILDPMVHSVEIYAITEDVTKLSGKYVEGMGYTDVTTKSVYRQNTIVSSEGGIDDYSRYFEEPLGGLYTSDFDLAARYNVVFNGTLYENLEVRSWVTHGGDGRTEYYIGSVNTLTGMIGDTNCPFTINLQGYTGENLVVGLKWESSYGPEVTLAIDRIEEVVHPIDSKYLPGGEFVVNLEYTDNNRYIADRTADEIGGAMRAGKTVVFAGKTDDGIGFKYVQVGVGFGSTFVNIWVDGDDLIVDALSYDYNEEVWVSRSYRLNNES